MIYSGQFTVVLDACTIYPFYVRDILLSLASRQMFTPKWSDMILLEVRSAILRNLSDQTEAKVDKINAAMNRAFPDAEVNGFDDLIAMDSLPDPNDNHVLACAIHCKADAIVTFNLKDFPDSPLGKYSISAIHPDDFIADTVNLDVREGEKALATMLKRYRRPQSLDMLINALSNQRLEKTAKIFIDLFKAR